MRLSSWTSPRRDRREQLVLLLRFLLKCINPYLRPFLPRTGAVTGTRAGIKTLRKITVTVLIMVKWYCSGGPGSGSTTLVCTIYMYVCTECMSAPNVCLHRMYVYTQCISVPNVCLCCRYICTIYVCTVCMPVLCVFLYHMYVCTVCMPVPYVWITVCRYVPYVCMYSMLICVPVCMYVCMYVCRYV